MHGFLKYAATSALTLAGFSNAAPLAKRAAPGGVQFLYWGADEHGGDLSTYCNSKSADYIIMGFVNTFGNQAPITASFGGCTLEQGVPQNCAKVIQDVKTCKSSGTKLLVSLGGWGVVDPMHAYGLHSDADGTDLGQQLYKYFGDPSTSMFGVAMDGIDFDIEGFGRTDGAYYAKAVTSYRSAAKAAGSTPIFTASPQCAQPVDENITPSIQAVPFDFINVQFYNNPNSAAEEVLQVGTKEMIFDDIYAQLGASKSTAKITIGLPAGDSATGPPQGPNYRISADQAKQIFDKYSSHPGYGGSMVWSAGWSDVDASNGCTYAQNIKSILTNDAVCGGSSTQQTNPNDGTLPALESLTGTASGTTIPADSIPGMAAGNRQLQSGSGQPTN